MSKFGKDLIESLIEAEAHASRQREANLRVTTVEVPDVKAAPPKPSSREE
jgi:hypothetical protein